MSEVTVLDKEKLKRIIQFSYKQIRTVEKGEIKKKQAIEKISNQMKETLKLF